jgi:hypothetical protein
VIRQTVKYVVLPLGVIYWLGGQALGTSAADTAATVVGNGGGLGVHMIRQTATEFQSSAKNDPLTPKAATPNATKP